MRLHRQPALEPRRQGQPCRPAASAGVRSRQEARVLLELCHLCGSRPRRRSPACGRHRRCRRTNVSCRGTNGSISGVDDIAAGRGAILALLRRRPGPSFFALHDGPRRELAGRWPRVPCRPEPWAIRPLHAVRSE
ncbi:hypothetical protein EMIHUDRAFT_438304 [Emiliania huxleyi CCMP1516]|uniref:Uncharacterized protein n=2 Tax=Emiliania huxleyi TaxID=2903 RepID=A0A0D3IAS7_EMIH1|nr:hypothetical protein EMIHUDRAFT_438304 [Emiliania huxleyi CCMP1516]EOD08362.1 hypothetical protein EMIHUDRAFT_438304 [Emiliania huxleyi CCMP1516]|eukprot:XP_005760791.1 hypothetical protein EMIHUDRAFT_438304 [Emiliania huxleyi CCMP1516]